LAERRSLVEGIKPAVSPEVEKDFVFQGKQAAEAAPQAPPNHPTTPQMTRVAISTRIRTDYAQALKRASLERQLAGIEPNTLQDILEAAVEPWLRSNGYLV